MFFIFYDYAYINTILHQKVKCQIKYICFSLSDLFISKGSQYHNINIRICLIISTSI